MGSGNKCLDSESKLWRSWKVLCGWIFNWQQRIYWNRIRMELTIMISGNGISSTMSWTKKAAFGGTAREYAVGFSIGNKGYIGTGQDQGGVNKNDFWEYTPSLSANITAQTNVTCNGGNNGSATVTAMGTPSYTYSWNTSPVQTSPTATGLTAGTYIVTVNDCSASTTTATVTITQPGVPNSWVQRANFGGT